MTPRAELVRFIRKFDPAIATKARASLAALRKLLPGANLLVYDNYNALAIAFTPTERASDAILSFALYPRWVSLFLVGGQKLADPKKLLRGSGATMRHVVLAGDLSIDTPAVLVLVRGAIKLSRHPLSKRRGAIFIKAVVAKQRPRRAKGL
jgi:hypothetical protein